MGVCDLGQGTGLVLCDIPGLIQGAAQGTGMGLAFLQHVQQCHILLHLVDGTSEDPINDFHVINQELHDYDEFFGQETTGGGVEQGGCTGSQGTRSG